MACAFGAPTIGRCSERSRSKTSDAWAVSPGSHYLLGPRDADEEGNTVRFQVIDNLTNEEVARITANRVRATAFGHDGRNIAIGSYPALELWQIIGHGSDTVRIAAGPEAYAIAFSAGETHLLVFSGPSANASIDFSAKVWDFAPDPQPSSLDLGPSVMAFALSADGRYLAAGGRILDPHTGQTVFSVFTSARAGSPCAFSSDGEYLAAAGDGETVRIWSIRDQEEVARIERVLQRGGNLRVWLLRYEDLAAEACSRLTRNMTRSEWREYFGDQAYHPTCPQLPVPEIAKP
jgi:WD40 repeat protein